MFAIKISLPELLPEYLVKDEMCVFSLDTSNIHLFETLEEAEAHIDAIGGKKDLVAVKLEDVPQNEPFPCVILNREGAKLTDDIFPTRESAHTFIRVKFWSDDNCTLKTLIACLGLSIAPADE